jgi:hypothetical protein
MEKRREPEEHGPAGSANRTSPPTWAGLWAAAPEAWATRWLAGLAGLLGDRA